MEKVRVSQGGFEPDVILGPRVADHGWGLGYMLNQRGVAGPNRRHFRPRRLGRLLRVRRPGAPNRLRLRDELFRRHQVQRRSAQRRTERRGLRRTGRHPLNPSNDRVSTNCALPMASAGHSCADQRLMAGAAPTGHPAEAAAPTGHPAEAAAPTGPEAGRSPAPVVAMVPVPVVPPARVPVVARAPWGKARGMRGLRLRHPTRQPQPSDGHSSRG